MHDPDATDTLQTTGNTLEIIEAMAQVNGGRVSDLASETDLAYSTVHAHLRTLYEYGYVDKRGDTYVLGPKFFHLGQHVRTRDELFTEIKRTVIEIARHRDERVTFAVEDRGRILVLYDESAATIQRDHHTGTYNYMHNTAAGKAILSALPEQRVDQILDRWGMPTETAHSITDRAQLKAELEEIRERGYALNEEENDSGIFAIGVPVHDAFDEVCCSITLYGPTYQIPSHEDVADTLLTMVEELEATIRSKRLY